MQEERRSQGTNFIKVMVSSRLTKQTVSDLCKDDLLYVVRSRWKGELFGGTFGCGDEEGEGGRGKKICQNGKLLLQF